MGAIYCEILPWGWVISRHFCQISIESIRCVCSQGSREIYNLPILSAGLQILLEPILLEPILLEPILLEPVLLEPVLLETE